MCLSTEQFEKGLGAFHDLVRTDEELSAELARSRRAFFPGPDPLEATERAAADRRHLEWFLFERISEHLDGLPAEMLLASWRGRVGEEVAEHQEAFLESQAGIFEVTGREADGQTWLRDLTGLGEFPLDEPEMTAVVQRGDLIVGRIFPVGSSAYRASPAAGFFRDPRLLEAIQHDLERIRAGRSHPLLRLLQPELERMFWGSAGGGAAGADPVGELREFLLGGGVAAEAVQAWVGALARSPFDAESLVPDAGDLVAGMLDTLAFETELDLDRARLLLLAAWSHLSVARPEEEPAARPGRDEVLDALAEYDADRRRGLDLDTSFRELERRLGIEETDEDEVGETPDFPGVVGAMVEEFLWEREREEGETTAGRHSVLRVFGAYASGVGVFENLAPSDFLAFAAFWIPESRRLRSGGEAAQLVRSLRAFADWARENHGLAALDENLGRQLDALVENLPRAVEADALIPADRENTGELFELVGTVGPGRARLMRLGPAGEDEGIDAALAEPRLLEHLRDGDLLRGFPRADGAFVVACCYPPEALALRADEP